VKASGVGLHVPLEAVRNWPTLTVPEIVGRTVFDGGASTTAADIAEAALAWPYWLEAVTITFNCLPRSEETGV
jgi:hypothetical protein